ncbi:MAG: hypothetical protein AAGA48_03450 [Myxococcota bacterium]
MVVALLSLLSNPASAREAFLTPMGAIAGPWATVTLNDGSTVTGKPNAKGKGLGNIKKITIKSPEGGKVKLTAADVKRIELEPGKMAKLATTAAGMGSVSEMVQQDHSEAFKRNVAIYLPARYPNGKLLLAQLLNPGMDAMIEVFPDPKGKETGGIAVGGVQATGGVLKTYLVRKKGEMDTVLIKKNKADEAWDLLFSDCSSMKRPEKLGWKDLPAQVRIHQDVCGPKPEPVEAPMDEAEPTVEEDQDDSETAQADGE